jgi:hypothetical protein
VAIAVIACLALLVPTEGSFYPVPPFPINIFPYLFAAYIAAGGTWLFILSRRRRGILAEIESDLEHTVEIHEQRAGATHFDSAVTDPDSDPAIA